MEQVAYRLLSDLSAGGDFRFRIASGRSPGAGWHRVLAVDREAQAFERRGAMGWRTVFPLRRFIKANLEGASAIWIVGTCSCCLAASRGLGVPRILSHHYHHLEDGQGGTRWKWFYRLLCRDLAAVTYPTAFTKKEAIGLAPWLKAKARVVRNGFSVDRVSPQAREERKLRVRAALGLPADALVVGNAGWLILRKRFDVFLDTAAVIARNFRNAWFVVCGDGSEREALEARGARLGLADRLMFTGWVDDPTRHYQSWDVCLFNSDFDTLPCTPMEAAAQGCPVVASLGYGGLGEFIEDGRNGFLFDAHDVEGLAARVCNIAADPDLGRRFVEASYDILENEFNQEKALEFYRGAFRGSQ